VELASPAGSGLKVDFMVADDSPFNRSRFARARDLQIAEGRHARFATPRCDDCSSR
jgi:hypothetical protein